MHLISIMETLRRPLVFTGKNPDSPFGEYIILSNGERRPWASLASARASLAIAVLLASAGAQYYKSLRA